MTDLTDPTDLMIRLENVTKAYPGQSRPAVQDLSLEVRTGEIVALLGPSGCGKTTTLRLINRLIEPTSGRIWINGQDVMAADPDDLRRHIGYVIQQGGLFPHMRIADNIGAVPRALGWNKADIARRTDELLELVGLDPSTYRRRYPKHLSGGQQQRVGVARALAADPPVLLMDEPFGALDPITRERLQDELLELQSRIGKTIVVVTHDIAEAIKISDRIAMFAEGGRLAQYDTPEAILGRPADDFVASFVGSGAAIRRLRLEPVESLPLSPVQAGEVEEAELPTVGHRQTVYDALDAMLGARTDRVLVLGPDDRPLGGLSLAAVVSESPVPGEVGR